MLHNDSTENTDAEKDEIFVRFFCRHLVSLSGWYHLIGPNGEESGQTQFFSYSGFILSIQGMWCLATAGHILSGLEQYLKDGTIRVTRYVLVDDFGPAAISHDPIPFDFVRAPKYCIYDTVAGLDFGLIGLSSYYQGLLQANGVVPVSEENWKHQHEVEFGHHMMIGLPQKFITTEVRSNQEELQLEGFVRPTTIDVNKLNEAPANVTETKYARFIGKISDGCLLDDITGMSGGPILGFSKEGDRYWVVAIQSSWLSESKIVFGCPVPVFAELVEKMVTGATSDGNT